MITQTNVIKTSLFSNTCVTAVVLAVLAFLPVLAVLHVLPGYGCRRRVLGTTARSLRNGALAEAVNAVRSVSASLCGIAAILAIVWPTRARGWYSAQRGAADRGHAREV